MKKHLRLGISIVYDESLDISDNPVNNKKESKKSSWCNFDVYC